MRIPSGIGQVLAVIVLVVVIVFLLTDQIQAEVGLLIAALAVARLT